MHPSRVLALLLILCCGTLRAQQPSSDVSVGLFPFLVGNMDSRVREVVDRCVANGADRLYVSVFRATGPSSGDLWITDNAGTWNNSWGSVRRSGAGIDLQALIGYAKQRGLPVIGVIRCFDASVQPTDAAHRQYLLDIIGWLVDGAQANGEPVYDLDGIALDYIRFVGAGSGNDPQLVTDLVRDIKSRIGVLTLHAYVIASRFYIDGPTYNSNFRSYADSMARLRSDFGQDWPALCRHLDVLMPMAYTADGSIYSTYAAHEAYVQRCASLGVTARSSVGAATHIVPVIKTYSSSGETTTDQTVEASITGAILGGDGFQTFRYETTRASWWAKVAQWATPGADFPNPRATVAVQGLSVDLDNSATNGGTGSLNARFDWDDDGVLDTTVFPVGTPVGFLTSGLSQRWVGMRVFDSVGHTVALRRQATAGFGLDVSSGLYRSGTGGPLSFVVDGGPRAAGHSYALLGSLSGSLPAANWSGIPVPLALDDFTLVLASLINTPLFQNSLGVLDAQGRATVTLTTPPGALGSLSYRVMTFAGLIATPAGVPACTTGPNNVLIFP